jgi:benzoate membrane transport protein
MRVPHLSAVSAGFVAVLVAFTSTIALVFHAARSLQATPDQISSWVMVLGLGMGVGSFLLSWWTRMPVLVVWSTPGAAVIASAAAGISLPEAIGAFLLCGALMLLCGVTGWFERIMNRIPIALASALLAGILARFALLAFAEGSSHPALVAGMLLLYLVGKRWWPRYAIVGVLLGGTAIAYQQHLLQVASLSVDWARPVWVTPTWSWQAMLGMGLPLFIVTMSSQAIPAVSAMRVAGYRPPVSPLMSASGLITVLLAPFGGYTFNLAAITASIVLSPQAHPDPAQRYTAAMMAGVFYIGLALLGGAVAGVLNAFPVALIMGVAGLALLNTIGNSLSVALADVRHREPALITFLVTLSGVTLWGVNSAFWGLLAGMVSLFVENYHSRPDSREMP